MKITENAKAHRVMAEGLSRNQNFNNAGGIAKDFDVFDSTENRDKKQCDLCNPPTSKPSGKAKLCPNCAANREQLETGIFQHLKQNRKVIRLQKCFACNKCFALTKFSQYFGICKKCLGNRDEPIPMRRKFAARALNNIQKVLQGAMCL